MSSEIHLDTIPDPLQSFSTLLKRRVRLFWILCTMFCIIGVVGILFLPKVYSTNFIILVGLYPAENLPTTITIASRHPFRTAVSEEYSRRQATLTDKWFDYKLVERGSSIEVQVFAREAQATFVLAEIIRDKLLERHTAVIEKMKVSRDFLKKKYEELQKDIDAMEQEMKSLNTKDRFAIYPTYLSYVNMKMQLDAAIQDKEEKISMTESRIEVPPQKPSQPSQPTIPPLLLVVLASSLLLSSVIIVVYDGLRGFRSFSQ